MELILQLVMGACAFWRRFQGFISFPLRLQWWRLLLVGLTVLQLMVMLLVLSWFSGCVKTMLCDWFPCFIMWRSLLDFNLFKYKKRVFLNCFTFVKNLNNTDGYFWRNICPSKIKIFPTKNYPTLARPSISPCILFLFLLKQQNSLEIMSGKKVMTPNRVVNWPFRTL